MTTLITGGGSNVGTHLGLLLKAAGREAIFASRSGNRIPEGFKVVKLDWNDASTYEGALNASPNLEYIYLVGDPTNPHHADDLIPFIDTVIKKGGIKKFVYLSATVYSEEGGVVAVPKYLKEKGVGYVILRPTWFTDNLKRYLGQGGYSRELFATAVPTGRIPFVATEDVARAGVKAITEDIVNKDIIVLGPELLTYDQLAKNVSEGLGRTVAHKAVSPEELKKIKGKGAEWIVDLEVAIENEGTEERWWNLVEDEKKALGVEVFVGPTTAKEWAEKNRATFN